MSEINKRTNLIGYGILFFVLMLLAGNGYLHAQARSGESSNSVTQSSVNAPAIATPPGGTIPVVSTGITVLHLAPFDANSDVTTTLTTTTGIAVSSTGITVGDRWAGSPVADSTQYMSFPSGDATISVVRTGESDPILLQVISLTDGVDNTVVLTGGANGWVVDTLHLEDSTSAPAAFYGKVRIVHVAPLDNSSSNTAVDIVEESGRAVDDAFNGLVYRDVSGYVTLPAGEYDWRANVLSNGNVIELNPFTLNSGAILTIYILGDGSSVQAAGLMVINELGSLVRETYLPVVIE